ncbi:hypothetical protein ACFU8Q_26010 [Streptomyces sp. NPDC057543]|uniref:hypothetical protein n=1 Tax=Streptomyces sp. NPDC057543 TaxID=3346163 RepID=UPI0036BE22DA
MTRPSAVAITSSSTPHARHHQLDCGKDVLAGAAAVLADATAGGLALRFTLTRVIASLRQVLVVAHSRGGRLRG